MFFERKYLFQLATVTTRLPRVLCVTRVMVSAGMASSVTIRDHAAPGAPMSPRRIIGIKFLI